MLAWPARQAQTPPPPPLIFRGRGIRHLPAGGAGALHLLGSLLQLRRAWRRHPSRNALRWLLGGRHRRLPGQPWGLGWYLAPCLLPIGQEPRAVCPPLRVTPGVLWYVRKEPQGSPCEASSAGAPAVVTATSPESILTWPTTWPGSRSILLPN